MAEVIKSSYSKIIKSISDELIEDLWMEEVRPDINYLHIDVQSDTEYSIMEIQPNTNLEYNNEYKIYISMNDLPFACMWVSQSALTIFFNIYAGFMLSRIEFFYRYNTYPRAFLFLAYGWFFTMIYLIFTYVAYHITNIYGTHSNEDKRNCLKSATSSFILFSIISLAFGILGGLYSIYNRSNPRKVDLGLLYIAILAFYICISLTVGEAAHSLAHIERFKNPQEKYKSHILLAKCILVLIMIAGLALICGCSVFLYELSIYCPEFLCSTHHIGKN
ncbi:hypothetical protein NEAUS03_0204 [Nematocida ausubeli]|nr:hypothetical protein NEAUS03_0204 [Nematocida ausubeli]